MIQKPAATVIIVIFMFTTWIMSLEVRKALFTTKPTQKLYSDPKSPPQMKVCENIVRKCKITIIFGQKTFLKFQHVFSRNCYFSDEKSLKYYSRYSQNYCLQELKSIVMQKSCGCVDFHLPREYSKILTLVSIHLKIKRLF